MLNATVDDIILFVPLFVHMNRKLVFIWFGQQFEKIQQNFRMLHNISMADHNISVADQQLLQYHLFSNLVCCYCKLITLINLYITHVFILQQNCKLCIIQTSTFVIIILVHYVCLTKKYWVYVYLVINNLHTTSQHMSLEVNIVVFNITSSSGTGIRFLVQ